MTMNDFSNMVFTFNVNNNFLPDQVTLREYVIVTIII